ncbi:uncharacterized protein [Procambarus clarkii]|uniref:uncharacterized protein isoform X2 n=1 Tax=Procambarus clarkii TaxID=6728 RepID=UPI001E6727DF|nr:uncharacterized protein LOC123746593 [Procambarus clarkii]
MIGLVVLAVVAAAASASPLAQGGRFVYSTDSSQENSWESFERGVAGFSLEYPRPVSPGVATAIRSGAAAPTTFWSGLFNSAFKPGTFPYNIGLDSPEDLLPILNLNNNPQTRSERITILNQVLNTAGYDISLDDIHHYPGLRTAIAQGDGKLLVNHSGEVFYRPGPPKPQPAQEAGTGVEVEAGGEEEGRVLKSQTS